MNQVLESLFEITITLQKANINIFIKFNKVQNQQVKLRNPDRFNIMPFNTKKKYILKKI